MSYHKTKKYRREVEWLMLSSEIQFEEFFRIHTIRIKDHAECDLGEDAYAKDCLHSHPFYQILWICEGCGICELEFNNVEVSKNSVIFIAPGVRHRGISCKGINGFCLDIPISFINGLDRTLLSFMNTKLFNPYIEKCCEILPENTSLRLYEIIELMIQTQKSVQLTAFKEITLKSLLSLFFLAFVPKGEMSFKSNLGENNLFMDFAFAVSNNVHYDRRVSFYSKSLGVNSNRLNQVCFEVTGKKSSEFIASIIIGESKKLLSNKKNSVKDVAVLLGFPDIATFTKYFKRIVGISPSEFKRMI